MDWYIKNLFLSTLRKCTAIILSICLIGTAITLSWAEYYLAVPGEQELRHSLVESDLNIKSSDQDPVPEHIELRRIVINIVLLAFSVIYVHLVAGYYLFKNLGSYEYTWHIGRWFYVGNFSSGYLSSSIIFQLLLGLLVIATISISCLRDINKNMKLAIIFGFLLGCGMANPISVILFNVERPDYLMIFDMRTNLADFPSILALGSSFIEMTKTIDSTFERIKWFGFSLLLFEYVSYLFHGVSGLGLLAGIGGILWWFIFEKLFPDRAVNDAQMENNVDPAAGRPARLDLPQNQHYVETSQ